MDPGLGFAQLLGIAQGNQRDNTTNNPKLLKTKFGGPKKEVREKGKLSANVAKFLEKKEEEERKKKMEEKIKRQNLNDLRSDRAKNKIAKHLKVTKSANKAVLDEAVDTVNTAVTLTGRKQCDEDDYGYESKASQGLYEKLMTKFEADPEDPMAKFSKSKPKEYKDLASAKDRVKQALRREEENPPIPGKRRRRTKEQRERDEGLSFGAPHISKDRKDRDSVPKEMERMERKEEGKKMSNKEREKEEARKKRLLQNSKKPPPTMDFQALLKIANEKKDQPVKVEKKGPVKESEFGNRPMTNREKEEYMRENRAKLKREGKLPPSPPPRKREKSPPSWDMSDDVPSKKMTKSSSPVPSSKPKIPRSEPGPQFHSAVKKSMPPPSERKRDGMDEFEKEKREIKAKMKELQIKKEEMDMKRKSMEASEKKRLVMEQNERKRLEFEKREEDRKRRELKEKQERRERENSKKELEDMQTKYKEMQRQMKAMEDKMKGSSSSKGSGKRDPYSVESRPFPGEKKRKDNREDRHSEYKRRIESDSEDEYDSEMDDFIDDTNDKVDISAEIRNIFGYDKRRYKDEDFDDRSMENNKFSSIMMEEARSARIGRQEDLEDMRREEEENKRKKLKMSKMRR